MEKEEKQVQVSDRYVMKEVPTQTGLFIGEATTDTAMTDKEVQLEILNKLELILKAVK